MPDRHFQCKPKSAEGLSKYAYPIVAGYACGGHNGDMENLRRIRDARGLTQTALAEMIGVNQGTIAKIENGTGNPTLRVIRAIAAALRVEPPELFGMPEIKTRVLLAIDAMNPEKQEAARVVVESMAGLDRQSD